MAQNVWDGVTGTAGSIWQSATTTFNAVKCALKTEEGKIAAKILIGTIGLAVGIVATAATGGAILSVIGSVVAGTIAGAAYNGAAYTLDQYVSGEEADAGELGNALLNGAVDGYAAAGAFAGVTGVAGWVKTGQGTVKYAKGAETIVDNVDDVVRTASEGDSNAGYYQDVNGRWHRPNGQFASNAEVGLPNESNHYLNRPYIRRETIDAVNNRTKVDYKTGQIYDSISSIYVDPSNVELGHITGNEFAYHRNQAESKGWTQSQFNDFMNNPDFYAWQDVYSNRSHKFEVKH